MPVRKVLAESLKGQDGEQQMANPEYVPAAARYLERIVVRGAGRVSFVPVDDIDWIEAAGVYVNLHVGAQQHLYRSSILHLLQRLDTGRFVRIHRSAGLNTTRIRKLRPRSHGD